jgi:hypothetical protein
LTGFKSVFYTPILLSYTSNAAFERRAVMVERHDAPPLKVTDKDSSSPDTVHDTGSFPLGDIIQQLTGMRGELEKFAEQNHARLTEMREKVRTDAASVSADLVEQLQLTQAERDAVRQHVECLKEEARRLQVERDLAVDQAAELRQRFEQQQVQNVQFDRVLQTLKDELEKREQELRAERSRYVRLEQEHAKLLEGVDGGERVEAEIRQRRDREAPVREPQTTTQPSPPGLRLVNFSCKQCGASLQATERRAGLVMKCSQCGRVVPVPKTSGA